MKLHQVVFEDHVENKHLEMLPAIPTKVGEHYYSSIALKTTI